MYIPTRRVACIAGWFIGTMYILCSFGTISAQASTVLLARHVSAANSSSLCPLSVDNGRMLTILFASENINIYHDPSHGYASIVFRLGSGAGRRSTTMAKTPHYRARLSLLLTMAKFCSSTHVPDHSAAADGFLTKPITAAVRGHTHMRRLLHR